MRMKIEVLVVDDHAIIRDGLRKILDDTDDLVVAGEAASGNTALEKVNERDWGVVILDISMPGRSGLELLRLIKVQRPRLPILVFSMHHEEQYAVRAIRAGASGYLSKDSDSELILPAIRKVASGGVFVSQKLAELLVNDVAAHTRLQPHTRLSNREYEVFIRLVRGVTLTAIAQEFSLSIKTVSTHKSHILSKMSMANQTDLVRYAVDHDLRDAGTDSN
jgi:DNA-binding NarL/FixJ family response regulator